MGALAILAGAGLTARPMPDGKLYVEPVSKLTDDLRQYIRSHKADILADLVTANGGSTDQATSNRPRPDRIKPDAAANDPERRVSVVALHPCGTCHWRRMPGAVRAGYCAGRDDLPLAYGLLHYLPDDLGEACNHYEAGTLSWSILK